MSCQCLIIAWPIQLKSFSLRLNFINLDMGNILSGSACSLAIPYLEKMVVHAAVPVMLLRKRVYVAAHVEAVMCQK